MKAMSLLFLLVGVTVCLADPYDDFNTFCRENFGAGQEELVYTVYGASLAFDGRADWVHASVHSAAIGFGTNLPAVSHVEYGQTAAYGQSTEDSERPFALHLHHLQGLQADTLYHYRLVATDERGNTLVSEDRTLHTGGAAGMIQIPGNLAGPPYVLDQANGTYVVTEDIVAQTRAFTIKADGVTLDLNGHTVIYDQGPAEIQGHWDDYVYSERSTFGVWLNGPYADIRILNGIIRQGANNGTGDIGLGFNPVYVSGSGVTEVAGIRVEYSGDSVGGLLARYGNNHVHHNCIVDRGTGIGDRHTGVRALSVENSDHAVEYNLIARTRHQGLAASGTVSHNEIYVDSWDTNSFGIIPHGLIDGNRIFGTGYHMVAIGWDNGITVSNNFIHLQGVAPSDRSSEYGLHASVNGIRLTQYGGGTKEFTGNRYFGNTIVVKGRDGCQTIRGVQFFSDPYVSDLVFERNVVKTIAEGAGTGLASCVVAQGLSERSDSHLPILYVDNTFMSNSCLLRFGDDYGSGSNHQFRNNRFVRIGSDAGFRTINIGYWRWHSYNNRILDSILEGGADLADVVWEGYGRREYAVGLTVQLSVVDVRGTPFRNQLIRVEGGGSTSNITTDEEGRATLTVLKFLNRAYDGSPEMVTYAPPTLTIPGYLPVNLSFAGQQTARFRREGESLFSPATIMLLLDR